MTTDDLNSNSFLFKKRKTQTNGSWSRYICTCILLGNKSNKQADFTRHETLKAKWLLKPIWIVYPTN